MATEREYPKHPLLGAAALVVRDGKVLLVKRRRPPSKGLWSVPGGLVEIGESPEQAARRELREELGIRIAITGLFSVAANIERDEKGKVKYDFVIIDYLARLLGGKIRPNEESSDYGWFSTRQVSKIRMSKSTRKVVMKCLQTIGNGR